MEPQYVELPELKLVGMCTWVTPERVPEIGQMWGRFAPRMAEIESLPGEQSFGVSFCDGEGFHYMAGLPVANLDHIPDAFVGKIVPASRYAVWTHKGPIQEFGATYQRITQEWFPACGATKRAHPTLELYDERFNPEDGETDIYVPIE